MSRPAHPSHVDENAYFGEVEDDHKDETVAKCVEVSDEENGEGAARPASPATKIRKRVEPASPATQLRKRVDFIICSNNNLKRIGHFDLTSDVAKCIGRVTDDDKPHANVLSPLPYTSCTGMNGRIQLHLATELAWQSIVANTKEVVEKFMQDPTQAVLTMALCCRGGKHRSAASASLLQDVVQHNFPDHVVRAQFGCRPRWWKCRCPDDCAEAGLDTQSLLDDRQAARMLTRRLWQAA